MKPIMLMHKFLVMLCIIAGFISFVISFGILYIIMASAVEVVTR